MRTRLPDRDEHWTPEQARLVLDEWRQSGESMAAFARQHGYAPPRLYWWKKQLGGDERRSATVTPTSTLALVPARVTSEAAVAIRVRGEIAIEIVDATPSWVAAVVAELARSLP